MFKILIFIATSYEPHYHTAAFGHRFQQQIKHLPGPLSVIEHRLFGAAQDHLAHIFRVKAVFGYVFHDGSRSRLVW
jgi:hypothetical protein